MAGVARPGRTANLKQLQRERLYLVDHAVQRGWVSKGSAEHGVRPGPACVELGECLEQRRPNRVQDPGVGLARGRHPRRFAARLVTAHQKGLVNRCRPRESLGRWWCEYVGAMGLPARSDAADAHVTPGIVARYELFDLLGD